MLRIIAIATAAALLIGAAATVATPSLVRVYAESKVDAALKRIRRQTTSVVNRGEVSVELSKRRIRVRDLSIEGGNRQSRTHVGELIIERPTTNAEKLIARRVTFLDITIRSAGETITIPRFELDNYSGPERGLTATPGVGRNARSQADLIGQVSMDRAVAPLIVFMGDETGVRRTVRNATIVKAVNGVIGEASISTVAIEAPYLPPDQAPTTSSIAISAGPIVYQGLDLPTLWRFYAGDGYGDRDEFLKSAKLSNFAAALTLRPGGRAEATAKTVQVEKVALRPLKFPVTTFDPIATKLRLGGPLTPAEIRDQLLFGVDLLRAVSFERIAVAGVQADIAVEGEPRRSARLASAEIGPYADGRIELFTASELNYQQDDGRRAAIDLAEATAFDARGFLDHADRIGRDEALLTTSPTAEEVVRSAPRIGSVELRGLDAAGQAGEIRIAGTKIDLNAPLDAVPQRVAFQLDGLDMTPSERSPLKNWFEAAQLDALRGSTAFSLTLDPERWTLRLDNLIYRVEQFGSLTARGDLMSVDPLLAIATGADLVDKFSAIELGELQSSFKDDGLVDLLIRRAATEAGTPAEVYREQIAREAQAQIFRLFGPPAENSAASAARFIRNPRSVEVTVTPRGPDQRLIDLIRAFDLGPAGLAQVVDVSILGRF
ncbi:hypothetical protein [Hansschlegelia zhihuaiae]|uniref:DUF748 domain-containing protein n=1 Tax=Hansschlegelia zhihuaiae TaxID=405005 RepID=A0A4Q0MK30_9HYPH|nr:hypothetical protein [Hansschlegelia zhihuaiae]RXF73950.1 hypothetical protein EK403_08255 [Hansschlegelia zhihuaiae]